MSREAMKQALEALRTLHDENMDYLTRNNLGGENNQCMVFARETITALRERLAQPEMNQWQGLTDEEINSVRHKRDWTAPWSDTTFARAIEAKLKEKNHG